MERSRWSRVGWWPPPVTMISCSIPLAIASSTPYWMVGLSTSGSISFGCALVTGRNRVPSPAAGNIALRTIELIFSDNLSRGHDRGDPDGPHWTPRTRGRGRPPHSPRRRPGHLLDAGHDRSDGDHKPSLHRAPAPRRSHDRRL